MSMRRAQLVGSAMALMVASGGAGASAAEALKAAPGAYPAIAKVDPRFQSYNVEMAEVIGGRFWAPYPKSGEAQAAAQAGKSGGVDVANAMFRKRDPVDLKGNRRLRLLARALGPAYVRVGGAWANTAYFQDDDAQPIEPPTGYKGVLTRAEWAGVVDFAKATDAKIVTSFGVSDGARNPDGSWNPEGARKLVNYTRAIGGKIYAAELINEPNVGPMVGLPHGYTAEAFARDAAVFDKFLAAEAPEIKSVGPASTGEAGFRMFPDAPGTFSTDAMMSAEPKPRFDIFAYHFYGAVSQRCAGMSKDAGISPDQALTEAWLGRADVVFDYYKARRDKYAPGAPIWITEMAEAGCGGDRWAATFLDTFRYVDQMGRMAKKNVAAIFHNTLGASDYALIDDVTGQPRPSYWAALIWRRLMGETVLDAGELQPGLHLYAQCLRDKPGGVAMVAINLDKAKSASLRLPSAAQRYTLTADQLQSGEVKLNGAVLKLTAGDQLPQLRPAAAAEGNLTLAPASITFLAFPNAANAACRAG